MRIRFYETSSIFRRPDLVKRLKFLTNGGWGRHKEGSAMFGDLEQKRKGWIILAWEAKRVIGWGYITKRFDDSFQIGVYVTPTWRRKGVGSKILDKAKNFSKEKKRRLLSSGWNTAGTKFYEKNKVLHTPYYHFNF